MPHSEYSDADLARIYADNAMNASQRSEQVLKQRISTLEESCAALSARLKQLEDKSQETAS